MVGDLETVGAADGLYDGECAKCGCWMDCDLGLCGFCEHVPKDAP